MAYDSLLRRAECFRACRADLARRIAEAVVTGPCLRFLDTAPPLFAETRAGELPGELERRPLPAETGRRGAGQIGHGATVIR